MKLKGPHWPLFLCLLFLPVMVFTGVSHGEKAWDLKGCIEEALQKSPLLRSKEQAIKASHETVGEKKGALFPRVDAYLKYTRLSDPQVIVPIKSFSGTPPEFSRDIYHTGLSLSIPIYEGGRLRTAIAISKLQELLTKEDLNFTREEVAYLIRIVFYQCLYLDRLGSAQEENIKALKKLLADAQKKLEVGRIRPVDLMRIQTSLHQERASLQKTLQERRRSLHLLSRLMGMNPQESLAISGRLTEDIPESYEMDPVSIDKLVETRPDIKKAKREVEVREQVVRLEKGLNYPKLSLVGDYGRRAGSGFQGDEEVWSAGITVDLNVFSGGVIKHRINRAMHEYLASKEALEDLRLKAVQEVKDAISKIEEAKAKISAERRSLATSKESFRIEKLRYETGAGVITDVLLSEAEWLSAKAGLAASLFELEQGKAELDRALGRTIREILNSEDE